MNDPEIEAMSTVAAALADLEENARERVLRWAAARFRVAVASESRRSEHTIDSGTGNGGDGGDGDVTNEVIVDEDQSYEHFAEMFAAASPRTNEDKALVAAYWVQIHEGHGQWQSRRLNTELKHLGYAIPNITDALSSNMRKKPQRIIQLKKSGSSQQANKTYKVTNEGIMYVRGMFSSGSK